MLTFKYRLHYFSEKLGREVGEVYWCTIINSLALALVMIFEPIYLYTLGYSLTRIMWFFVEVYVLYLVFITLGAKFASRFGYKHSIFVSNIFYVAYWMTLFSIKSHPALILVAPAFYALQKSWFWPAYDAEVALATVKTQRGRETGVLYALTQFAFIIGPLVGGLVSENFGFFVMFSLASILMILSVYPLFTSPEVYSRHEFKFPNFFKMFSKHKRNFFGYWGYAEDLTIMSLWPVYMYLIIPDFLNLGLISTIATVIGTMLMLYIGKLSDSGSKRSLIRNTSTFYAATWIIRFMARDLWSVVTFDALTKTGKDLTSVPMTALTFERAGEG
ncbi:MFS transporter, partial [bacterium]